MQLTPQQLKDFDELGYLVLPNCFSDEEMAVLRSEAEGIFDSDRQEVWREKSGAPRTAFAAHTYNKALRHSRPPPAPHQAARAVLRRAGLHAPVQNQRQGGLRWRGLAVAPGLRHLEARRRHAGGARHEHLGVPRRGHALQRATDVHSQEPQARHARGRPRQGHHQLSALDARQGDGDQACRGRRHRRARPASPEPC